MNYPYHPSILRTLQTSIIYTGLTCHRTYMNIMPGNSRLLLRLLLHWYAVSMEWLRAITFKGIYTYWVLMDKGLQHKILRCEGKCTIGYWLHTNQVVWHYMSAPWMRLVHGCGNSPKNWLKTNFCPRIEAADVQSTQCYTWMARRRISGRKGHGSGIPRSV